MILEPSLNDAEKLLGGLAEAFLHTTTNFVSPNEPFRLDDSRVSAGPDYEARYKALVEHIPAVIFIAPLEAGRGSIYVSAQVETMLGFTREEWLEGPLRWYRQVHPEDRARWRMDAASLFLSGQPLASTYRVIARDGRVVWFQCNARMVHSSNGNAPFIQGTGFDVTEVKEAEASLQRAHDELERRVEERTRDLERINTQLKEEIAEHERTESLLRSAKEAAESAARVKSEFMANMSHEIRTPVNGVLGLTSLLSSTELTEEQREYVSVMHSSAESLLGIINQLLDFARAERGRTQLERETFHLRGSVAGLLRELRHQASEKALTLDSQILPEVPDRLIGDLVRLRQVLVNLIGNAIKFTESGRVDLKIGRELWPEEKKGSSCVLRFSVVDTGIGIPASKLKAVFEPFVQADGSITREYGGTGLGLAISKEIVTMMGGKIEVASKPGRGSVFSFTARFGIALDGGEAKPAAVSNGQGEERTPAETGGRNEPLRVLVVEDNPVNQKVAIGMLKRHGHTVTLVTNGLEALGAYGESRFDIVLMDVQMPVMDGLSATQAIREIEAQRGGAHLPIIGLTAHALPSDQTRCLEAGMDGFLSKPFKLDELLSLMQELTSQYAARNLSRHVTSDLP